MILVDLNILLYAVNDDAPLHRRARRWWESALSGGGPVGLSWSVLLGFLRISTKASLFPGALTPDQALAVVDGWLRCPSVVLVNPGEKHWTILQQLLTSAGVAGNLTTDAHLAALALEYGAELVSTDNDFRRFGAGLKLLNPLA